MDIKEIQTKEHIDVLQAIVDNYNPINVEENIISYIYFSKWTVNATKFTDWYKYMYIIQIQIHSGDMITKVSSSSMSRRYRGGVQATVTGCISVESSNHQRKDP